MFMSIPQSSGSNNLTYALRSIDGFGSLSAGLSHAVCWLSSMQTIGLVSAADAFFTEQLCVRAEVTSSDHRIQAHIFYQQQGYAIDERRFVKRYDSSGAVSLNSASTSP